MHSHSLNSLWQSRWWSQLISLALVAGTLVRARLDNETSPTHIFRSRPDLHAPIIDIRILRPELLSPGYIFLAPYRNRDAGPYIYDNWGNLVWSAAGDSGPKTAHAPQVCAYKDEQHLCFFQGNQYQGFARGHGSIMDKSYRIVKTIDSSGAGTSNDMHEFRMTPYSNGKSVLMTIYQPRMYDLTTNPDFKIKAGMGWIAEGVFQEVDIETGRVVFEWRSTDHVDPAWSKVFPGSTDTSGNGLSEETPWDYFHINSIDKNKDGDYLVSGRHTCAIYKLSGVDGHVIWEMGGVNPTFQQTNFNFSYQHDARWMSENETHTTLSFFDNASNSKVPQTNDFSHGRIVVIDHIASTATVVKQWGAPEAKGGLLSGSQGSMQVLPNGNVHIGWGEHAYFSEHTPDGDAIQYGVLAQRASNVMIYRSHKFNWTGMPITKPALWTFSRTGGSESGMVFYVSWNGATEVRSWNFYTAENASGPFYLVAEAPKTGYETTKRSDNVSGWAFAEALDGEGRLLERSMIAKTFVPSMTLQPYCDDFACGAAVKDEDTHEEEPSAEKHFPSPDRGFDTTNYYAGLPRADRPRTVINFKAMIHAASLAMAVLGVVAAVLVMRRSLLPSARFLNESTAQRMGDVRDFWSGCHVRSGLGRYVRIMDEEDKSLMHDDGKSAIRGQR